MRLRALVGALAILGLAAATPAAAAPAGRSGNFPAVIDLPDGFQPEGITSGAGTTLYVGSLAGGAVWRGDARTGDGAVLAEGADGRVAVGVEYDHRSGLLWVAGGPTGEVRAHDAGTGQVVASYTVAGSGFLNDLVVTRDAVYVTDSMVQRLVVVPLDADGSPAGDAGTLPLSGDLEYVEGFNANGIVAARGYLVLVQSNAGLLFRVDPDTGDSVQIDLGGYSVGSGDGLELVGSTLYVVRNFLDTVATIRLGAHLLSGTLVAEVDDADAGGALDVPTTITVAAGRLWAVNARFSTLPGEDTAYWVTQVPRR